MISIASLIYRSPRYADAVWKSAHEFTPALHDGRARFFFVANDATEEVLAHLRANEYPHVVQTNERLKTRSGLKERGFDPPEYIRRVYQGWNRAILESDEVLVLVNSDCIFSPGWFDALIEKVTPKRVVCSKLVERKHPRHDPFPGALHAEFGGHPDRFDKDGFLNFCDGFLDYCHDEQVIMIEAGGAYMPCAMYKSAAIKAGLYPEGNPFGAYGDAVFFDKLKANGVQHITALDSLVYHFKEGEMDE